MLRALVGPTASGKTDAGIALATRSGVEIASVDSMLVYRGMDVGTAKPTAEQQRVLPHHLIDLAEPSERFTVERYQQAAHDLLDRVPDPLLVGGSGLYFRAVVDRLRFPPDELYERLSAADPVAAARIDPANVRRTIRALEVSTITGAPFSDFAAAWEVYDPALVRVAGIRLASATLDARVRVRVARMLETGWIDEVRDLMERGFGAWLTASQAIGYAELAAHLDGRLALDEAMERTVKRTKELARRQMAWFRRDPRVRWFDAGEDGAVAVVDEVAAYLGAA
jgi:tRNA dimethylallyltransferase